MARKIPLFKQQIKELKAEGTSKPYTMALADLVMMQMAGDFTEFLQSLPGVKDQNDFAAAARLIAKTKKEITTAKLFPSIVEKTIEAQFGEQHAALRELPQNALDAYNAMDYPREVHVDLHPAGEHFAFHVRDFGSGMDLPSLVKNLLIPYNSGKEYDPTKIGEHGIGWYSVVDFAEVVKVISRPQHSSSAVQALIYYHKKAKEWRTTILPQARNGFARWPEHDGTEVRAFVRQEDTSAEKVRDALYQYVGMVRESQGKIFLGEEHINLLADEYQEGPPANIAVNGQTELMRLAVSKRVMHGNTNDPRFKHRDQNLDKIVFTQRGLFVKYESLPFKEGGIQAALAKDIMRMGLDFWVDLPMNVTLTKGRNDIISDHQPLVLEGLYRGFEDLFLDVLLEDHELMQAQSGSLLESIAHLFDRTYAHVAKVVEENKYSRKRRFIAKSARIGSKVIDVGSFIARECSTAGRYMGGVFRDVGRELAASGVQAAHYFRHDFGSDIVKAAAYMYTHKKEWAAAATRAAFKGAKVGVPLFVGVGGTLYGVNLLYEKFGMAVPVTAGALAGTVATGKGAMLIYENRHQIAESFQKTGKSLRDLYSHIREQWHDVDLHRLFSGTAEVVRDGAVGLLHKVGLYVNIEEKRERKREKRVKNLTKKYLSSMYKDEFLRKIMHKEIIPAILYHSVPVEQEQPQHLVRADRSKGWFASLTDMVVGEWNASGARPYLTSAELYYQPQEVVQFIQPQPELRKTPVKLSIDQLVEIHLAGNLITTEDIKTKSWKSPTKGSYLVNNENPLVQTVVDRLRQITTETANIYNVKVLEDHLDNIMGFAKQSALGLYIITPPGMLHVALATIFQSEKMAAPLADSSLYAWIHKRQNQLGSWYASLQGPLITKEQARHLAQGTYSVGKAVATFSFKVGYHTGRWSLEYIIAPSIRAMDPRRYPKYAQNVRHSFQHWLEENEKSAAEKRKHKEEENRARLAIPQEERQTPLTVLWDYCQSVYRRTFGQGVFAGTTFDDVGKHRVETVARIVGIGYEYVNYMNVVEALDTVICEALGTKPFTSRLCHKNQLPQGMMVDKKGRLHLDAGVDNINALIPLKSKSAEEWEQTSEGVAMHLVDLLIHQRTHDALKLYKHKQVNLWPYPHLPGFYIKKKELQQKVLDYFLEQRIHPGEIARQEVAKTPDIYFDILPQSMGRYLTYSRKGLRELRVQYEVEREKKRQEDERKALEKL